MLPGTLEPLCASSCNVGTTVDLLTHWAQVAAVTGGLLELSFWLAQQLPVSDVVGQKPPEADTAVQRLRLERQAIAELASLRCRRCRRKVCPGPLRLRRSEPVRRLP
jgi:hypothetical protein